MGQDIPKTIKDLIARGKTDQAIRTLLDYTETEKPEWSYSCVLISNRYSDLNNRIINGLKIEKTAFAEINHSILMLLEKGLSENYNVSEKKSHLSSHQIKKKKYFNTINIILILISLIIFVFAIIFWANQIEKGYKLELITDLREANDSIYRIDEVYLSIPVTPEHPSYLITVRGQLRNENTPVYGKYYHEDTDLWYDDWNLEASIIPEATNNSWIITFGHDHLADKKEETFKFGLFDKPGNDNSIIEIEFYVTKEY